MLVPHNTTPTEAIIDVIKSELSNATKSWVRIANAFSEAEEQYGYSSNAFREIMKATGFGLSTATKLVKIARSERLKRHADAVGKVQAWTVLYAIASLTDEQFDRLLASVEEDQVITSAMVAKAKASSKPSDPYQAIFTIRIDKNALRGDLVDGDALTALTNLVAQIQDTIPYVRVDATNRAENAASWHMSGIQSEYKKLVEKRFREAIASYKAFSPEWKRYRKNSKTMSQPYLNNFVDETDAMVCCRENPAEAFAALGSDRFNQVELYNEAAIAFSKKTETYAEKANNAFRFAKSIDPIPEIDWDEVGEIQRKVDRDSSPKIDTSCLILA